MSLNQQSKSRSSSYLARTQGFLRTQLWVWPLVAAVVLALVAVTLRLKVEGALMQQIASNLQVILNANAEALRRRVDPTAIDTSAMPAHRHRAAPQENDRRLRRHRLTARLFTHRREG